MVVNPGDLIDVHMSFRYPVIRVGSWRSEYHGDLRRSKPYSQRHIDSPAYLTFHFPPLRLCSASTRSNPSSVRADFGVLDEMTSLSVGGATCRSTVRLSERNVIRRPHHCLEIPYKAERLKDVTSLRSLLEIHVSFQECNQIGFSSNTAMRSEDIGTREGLVASLLITTRV
ncbi:uncharacterized protein ARMOST_02536 [Armillaria ostoyae]|uniref:Uncharacterized protein n=1 Tax=Armillaria ostoyae TaxID=47428 RepID=A0A284QS03_ARMOS|nr:uncharacterized protein ARMOST_02536 [Armillaria ostoyae]